jgi:hypothetical protein
MKTSISSVLRFPGTGDLLTTNTWGYDAVSAFAKRRGLRLFLIVLLIGAVIAEGYYIFLLQNKIEERNDELKNISVQLQFLKSEGEDLKSRLLTAEKTTAGDVGNGNTAER